MDIVLKDGRAACVRAMLPTDEEELLQAFERLGPDGRYMRFLTAKRYANVERLRTVLASFPEKGFAVAATVAAEDGIDIVGTASFMRTGEAGGCEFAIAVLPAWAGAGLGRILLEAVIGAARDQGLAHMEGFVLAANRPMLALATRLGFRVAADPEDPSMRIARLDLT
jgi:acetyltransferase